MLSFTENKVHVLYCNSTVLKFLHIHYFNFPIPQIDGQVITKCAISISCTGYWENHKRERLVSPLVHPHTAGKLITGLETIPEKVLNWKTRKARKRKNRGKEYGFREKNWFCPNITNKRSTITNNVQ